MKKTFTIISLLTIVLGFSQTTISKSSIGSGGASVTNGTTNVIYSIGEVAMQETTVGTIHISEGFISSKTLRTLGVNNYTKLGNVSIYPNPAVDFININFKEVGNYEISIFDFSGKKLNSIKTNKVKQQLNLESYFSGVYLLLIKNTEKQVYKTFKIVIK